MSIYPSPDKLDALESKYALVILAAKRARQIKDNARRLVDTTSKNPLTVALEEIAEGAIVQRVVEDATVAAHQAALKPNVPSLEDIIGAGPVLALDMEQDSTAAQLAAFRNAEPDSDEDDLLGDDGEDTLRPVDAFVLDAPGLVNDLDEEEEDLIPSMDDEEE
ncbi:MAG TPA: DNA-directed RNA polymerase subunit omega [Chthonomonadaceae bacterium]|nr:DNA-directed RNA polymerase subunit omega [Chthonomonadaceae bacterium]